MGERIVSPLQQQRALMERRAVFHDNELGVIRVAGEDRLTWLHGVLSQSLLGLKPGDSTETLLLDAQGHIVARFGVITRTDDLLLLVAANLAAELAEWFSKMRFRSKVEVSDLSAEYAVVSSWGEPVAGAAEVWRDPWPATSQGGVRYGEAPTEPWHLVQNLIPAGELAGVLSAHDTVDRGAIDALRIAAHRPDVAEIDDKTLPHELDWLSTAVHLSKGCYRGQETVAKVHNLGHPPRRLVMLHLDGSGHLLPEVGAQVALASEPDNPRGRITSVGQHHEAGPIALAVVSRSVAIDAPLLVHTNAEHLDATQEVIVPQSAGKAVELPRASLLGKRR